jgi:hypothetical protein
MQDVDGFSEQPIAEGRNHVIIIALGPVQVPGANHHVVSFFHFLDQCRNALRNRVAVGAEGDDYVSFNVRQYFRISVTKSAPFLDVDEVSLFFGILDGPIRRAAVQNDYLVIPFFLHPRHDCLHAIDFIQCQN